MPTSSTLDRRDFIRLSALAAAIAMIPGMAACTSPTPIPPGTERPDFLSQVSGKDQLRAIGKAYLKDHPEESDADKLYRELMKGHPGNTPMSAAELTAYFNNAIAADFTNDRLVVASGWVLSVTEARQCALFSILNPGS